MKTNGACFCGELTFEAEVDPEKIYICYCSDCQTFSGGACHVNTFVPEAGFKMTKGDPVHFIKVSSSGSKRDIGFCGTCGTEIHAVNVDGPKVYGVRVPTLAERDQLQPVKGFYLRSRQPWIEHAADLPGEETQWSVRQPTR